MIPARVIDRVVTHCHSEGDCLVSDYSVGSHGYSQIGWREDGKRRATVGHRVAWEAVNGPIPDDLTIDHVCRNRQCINVDHLRLLSNVDNSRANGMSLRTHCPSGHAYDEANTYVNPKGHRHCRACRPRWR